MELEISRGIFPALLFLVSLIIAWFVTGKLIKYLNRKNILAIPNERSSHAAPVPVGGGWVIVFLAVAGLGWSQLQNMQVTGLLVLAGIIILAMVSWYDDRKESAVNTRLIVQALMVGLVLVSLSDDRLVFAGFLPLIADRLLTALCWMWFVNLFNFMDGIDGISGVQILQISAGLLLMMLFTGANIGDLPAIVILAGATTGFLWWNWHPARIFLGDVGAVPIGFFLGWLLIKLAIDQHLASALIISMYYLSDSSLTLLSRLIRGKKIWHAHREHYYQRAAVIAKSHSRIVLRIVAINLILLVISVWALDRPGLAMGVALVFAILSLRYLSYGLAPDRNSQI